jgi:hypothetical protein
VRYYVTISSYDRSGLQVDGRTRGAVYSTISAGGAAVDLVRVGSVTAKAVDAPPPAAGDLMTQAGELQSIVDPLDDARSFDTGQLEGATDLDLLKSFVETAYEGDEELLAEYVWEANASTYTTDERKAGILSASEAKDMLLGSIQYWYDSWDGEPLENGQVFSLADMKTKAGAKLDDIAANGAVFAYDGYWQHGCAAPTPFLVVIDKTKKAAYGLDLNPCRE